MVHVFRLLWLACRLFGGKKKQTEGPAGPHASAMDAVRKEETGADQEHAAILIYETGWGQAFVHWRPFDGDWTAEPGVLMKNNPANRGTKARVLRPPVLRLLAACAATPTRCTSMEPTLPLQADSLASSVLGRLLPFGPCRVCSVGWQGHLGPSYKGG